MTSKNIMQIFKDVIASCKWQFINGLQTKGFPHSYEPKRIQK